jgi:hypothetical protein
MAVVNLLFDRGPLVGPPFHLLFGDDGEVTVYQAELAGALPGPTFAGQLALPHDSVLVAQLPAPAFAAAAVPAHDSVLAAALPAPTFEGLAVILSGVVYDAALAAVLPGPDFAATAAPAHNSALTGQLPALSFMATGSYDSNVSRPTVGQASQPWQVASPRVQGAAQPYASGVRSSTSMAQPWAAAEPARSNVEARQPASLAKARTAHQPSHEEARPLRSHALDRHAELLRRRGASTAVHQNAAARRASQSSRHQERLRDRRPALRSLFGPGMALHRPQRSAHQLARQLHQMRGGVYQEAMRPPAGYGYRPPVPPQPDPCYTPSTHLLFAARPGGTHLVFVCDKHDAGPQPVIVPIREVYMVTNNVSLVRLVDGAPVPVLSASLSLDVDSWAWRFAASLPGAALALVEPGIAGPVELLASVNGTVFHVLAEQVSRDRSFGQAAIRIAGRGRNAVLDSPYAPVQTFTNSGLRTSQQLMDDVLTLNGVPLGWTVDWGLEAWNVPAGVFSHQGSCISALMAIAQAGGAYLLPHAEAKSFRVRPRYPVAPWAWGGVTPDFVLPSAVVTRESMAWMEKPAYNRVYVHAGHAQGVLGQVTRAGSAGDSLAPMVVDSLITTAAAARQRGLAVLADTGRQVEVGLRLPVLAETGIIMPGAFVQYEDGPETRLGLVRSVGIEAGFPDVWQTLGVETHA